VRRLCQILLHFLFDRKVDGAIFCVMVGVASMVHAVWRFHCVWVLAAPSATVRSFASLVVLGDLSSKVLGFLLCEGPLKFFSQFSGGPQPSESMLCTGFG
jgi:hypothetical protein